MKERKIEVRDLRILFSGNTEGSYEKLRSAVVGIAGAGGLGSTVAVMLARAGVGIVACYQANLAVEILLKRQRMEQRGVGWSCQHHQGRTDKKRCLGG